VAAQDTGTFDEWIADRVYFGTLEPRSGNTGTFDEWLTDRIYFDAYQEVAAAGWGPLLSSRRNRLIEGTVAKA